MFPVTRTRKLSGWRAFVDSFVTCTHCVAQVPERMKSVRRHHRMSILRLCIVRCETVVSEQL